MERDVMMCERKILRKIYGLTYENGYWRINVNPGMYNDFKYPDTVTS
jgi:hypothetical protein